MVYNYEVGVVSAIFRRISDGELLGQTPVVTLTEVLVQPMMRTDIQILQKYRSFLLGTSNFQMLPIDIPVAERAADLRARYRLRTPDALQIATALQSGCEAFLTNDLALKRVTDLTVWAVDELTI
jgi:predicted nucleic acid-binding protein